MSDKPSYRLEEMTWPEVKEAAEAGRAVLQPLAAIEQHGPHLPVDTDNLIARSLCEAAAQAAPGEFLVAPVLPYGFNDHNMEFPGTISIRSSVLIEYLFDVGRSFASNGFSRLLWVNGHGSNVPVVDLAARRISIETPMLSGATSSIALARSAAGHLRTSPPGGVAHACEFETSLYLHLRPELVKTELIADEFPQGLPSCVDHDWLGEGPLTFMSWYSQRSRTGVDGAPSHASVEKGEQLFKACVELLLKMGREFKEMRLPERVDHRPKGGSRVG
jgi:creatinine amidohydrolase